MLVLGCDHIGSAVARRLHAEGLPVVLIDRVDPPWDRRGMAYTDAWYVGVAEVEGVPAVFCSSVRSIPAVLDRGEAIAATTWSWMGVAAALSPGAIVDARHVSARRASVRVRGPASSIVIEIASGAVIGPEFAVAVGATEHEAREGVVYAAGEGFFSTGRRIGETVRAGETVGTVAGAPVIATIDGRLRGLPARGARIHAGNRVLEVDPGKPPAPCFGVDAYGRAVADRVAQALDEARCLRSRASASVV